MPWMPCCCGEFICGCENMPDDLFVTLSGCTGSFITGLDGVYPITYDVGESAWVGLAFFNPPFSNCTVGFRFQCLSGTWDLHVYYASGDFLVWTGIAQNACDPFDWDSGGSQEITHDGSPDCFFLCYPDIFMSATVTA